MYRIGKVGVFTLEYVNESKINLINGYEYTAIVMDLYNEDNIPCTHVEILNSDTEIKPFFYFGGFVEFSNDWRFIAKLSFDIPKLKS